MSARNEDQIQLLFPTVVQVSQLDIARELNSTLLQVVNDLRKDHPNTKPQSWACELYTTIGNSGALLEIPEMNRFLGIALEKITQYAETYKYPVTQMPPRITECWVNVYGKGHSQEIHIHKNSMFSGIYYLQVPEGSGATLFYSPSADVMVEPRPSEGNNINATVTGFPPIEGRMMVFRSCTRHSVLPGDFEGERITISFNAIM